MRKSEIWLNLFVLGFCYGYVLDYEFVCRKVNIL